MVSMHSLTIDHSEPGTEMRCADCVAYETRVPACIREGNILQHQYLWVGVLAVRRLSTDE